MSTQSLFLVHTLITISECVGMLWTCNIAILKQKYTNRSVLSFYTIVLSSSLKLASRVENVLCMCACVSPLLHNLGENSADNSGSWDTTPPVSLSLSPDAKLDAVELLLHSFGSAATFLNPQATRCSYLYSLEFDPSGTLVAAAVRVRRSWKLCNVGEIWVVFFSSERM